MASALSGRGGRARRGRRDLDVLVVISLGGMLGASARYGAGLAWPTPPGSWPWTTLVINVSGCLLIGVLMVFVVERGGTHRLLRPFLGVGLLGGYTTFSTYAVEGYRLMLAGAPAMALLYVVGTALLALLAVQVGVLGTRLVMTQVTRRRGAW